MKENNDFIGLTDNWITLLQNSGEDAALSFYCENIIPVLLPILHDKFQKSHGHSPQYDGLISLLGFAPDTVILAYQFIKPETLVVIHTKETKHFLDVVLKHSKIPLASFFHESFSETPMTDIYRALEVALKRFPKGSRIAIELTGGKKTMSGALAVASGILDIDLLYIDYTDYMPQFRKPKPESTYIHLVGNPMKSPVDLFSEIEINRAVSFFNIGKYDMSRTLFEQASQRMANPRIAEVCADLSQFYLFWNSFAFDDALELSSALLDKVFRFYEQISSLFLFDLECLKRHNDMIRKLSQEDRMSLLCNFYFSAERYEGNNQKDIAALLYYRTVESIFDNCLKDLSEKFDRETPDYSIFEIDKEELQKNYNVFRRKIFKKNEFKEETLPLQIAMFDALCLLGSLNHPIANKINLNRVANTAKIRNRSVYAHGMRPIDTQSVTDIYKLATDTFQAYIDIKQIEPIESQRKDFEFMKLTFRKRE